MIFGFIPEFGNDQPFGIRFTRTTVSHKEKIGLAAADQLQRS